MKGMSDMIRQAQKMQRKMSELQEELKTREVEAQAGGGMITVTATCGGQVAKVSIDPSVLEAGDKEMLEDLVLAAVNEALKQGREVMEAEMGKLTGGINIPGLF